MRWPHYKKWWMRQVSLPKRAEAYAFQLSLVDSNNPENFITNPTIITGDFKISKDDGALVNLVILPVVAPAGSTLVLISLTSTEMTADRIAIVAVDQGSLWEDVTMTLDIPTGNVDTVNDLLEGDRSESSTGIIIKRKGTATEILNKTITGSLLSPSVTVTTNEP